MLSEFTGDSHHGKGTALNGSPCLRESACLPTNRMNHLKNQVRRSPATPFQPNLTHKVVARREGGRTTEETELCPEVLKEELDENALN